MVRLQSDHPRCCCVFSTVESGRGEWDIRVLLWDIRVFLWVDFGLFLKMALYCAVKKRYDNGKVNTGNSGSRQRPGGAGGGLCEQRALYSAECADDNPQPADGAAAGGSGGVRHAVGAGVRHACGVVGGTARRGCGAGHECSQPLYQDQPRLCQHGRRGDDGGLQPRAGVRRGAGGGGVRRGAARRVAGGGLVCRDTACRVRSRRCYLLRTRHAVSLRYRLRLSVCLCAAAGRGGAVNTGTAARGECVADASGLLGGVRGAAVRLCVEPRCRVLA